MIKKIKMLVFQKKDKGFNCKIDVHIVRLIYKA